MKRDIISTPWSDLPLVKKKGKILERILEKVL